MCGVDLFFLFLNEYNNNKNLMKIDFEKIFLSY